MVGLGAPETVPSMAMSISTPVYGVIKGRAWRRFSTNS
jgi:hypothetical protein